MISDLLTNYRCGMCGKIYRDVPNLIPIEVASYPDYFWTEHHCQTCQRQRCVPENGWDEESIIDLYYGETFSVITDIDEKEDWLGFVRINKVRIL